MFRSLSIGMKLVISVAISIVLGLIVFVFIISAQVKDNISDEVEDKINQASKRYANLIEGSFNETIILAKSASYTINSILKTKGSVRMPNLEYIIKNSFESSSYATYAFLILEDTSVLEGGNINPKYLDNKGHYGMVFL
ncbi:hypothetical protein B6S12_10460 [Helicobacter valdiviensis]|uniref:Chemotaxis protein n=1 Tax=Helicobacter valdiviensis TaxID=1458358 RepID=A0A2W6MRI0_9HELI|nr:hypothetical protein [Helicobacter valdiviensis]PZT47177.1 hypothetical protein B6S12_10460 [Helicobacter valdiviensis]